MDPDTWNVLHDGRIIAAQGQIPGSLQLSIEIDYLCNYLPTQANYLIVNLSGCKRFDYQSHDGQFTQDPSLVAAMGITILSADAAPDHLNIACLGPTASGELLLQYDTAQVTSAEGQTFSQSAIESAAETYWTNWQQNIRKD